MIKVILKLKEILNFVFARAESHTPQMSQMHKYVVNTD